MSEQLLQAEAQQEDASLWTKAPAWRTLTVTASLLTLAAVATPLLLPQPSTAPAKPVIAAAAGKMLLASQPPTLQPQTSQSPTPAHDSVALATPPAAPPTPAPVHHAVPMQPLQTQAACALKQTATAPRLLGFGTVVSFEDRALAMARIQMTEQGSGGKIDPAFIDNQRVVVKSPTGQLRTFILPKTMAVQIGDRVMVQDGYRNMALPCNYVPNEIASDLGPAPAPTVAGQGAAALPSSAAPQEQALATAAPNTQTVGVAPPPAPASMASVPSGVRTEVNQHNRHFGGGDLPIIITVLTPPAHGSVTTQGASLPVRTPDGSTQTRAMTQVYYQSQSGFTGQDSFTYRRTSPDPTDPLNSRIYTMVIDVR